MVTHRLLSLSLSLFLSLSPRPLPRGLIDYGEVVQVIHMTLVAMVLYAGLLSWKFNWEVGCTYALQVSVYVVSSPNQILCVYPAASSKNTFTEKTRPVDVWGSVIEVLIVLSVTNDVGVGTQKSASWFSVTTV